MYFTYLIFASNVSTPGCRIGGKTSLDSDVLGAFWCIVQTGARVKDVKQGPSDHEKYDKSLITLQQLHITEMCRSFRSFSLL